MAIFINFLLGIFVLDSLLLILMVLMQRPKSEGLGAAFGGGMTENLFGAQTTNVLANFTRYLGGIFFGLALLLSVLYAKQSQMKSSIQQELIKTAKPVTSGTAAITDEKAKNAMEALVAKKVAADASPVATGSSAASASPAPAASATSSPKAKHAPSATTPKP